MENLEFNFKKHQNFSKSWKTLVRFIIYSVVISFLIYLIINAKNLNQDTIKKENIDQINIKTDEIQIEEN